MRQKGFTLIEIMVVISITAVLGALGIAGFANYNKAQVLQTSANEIATMLNLAKSRAQSQIKPSGCTGNLKGYLVKIVPEGRNYTLYFRCSTDGKVGEQDKILPINLKFSSGSDSSIFFPVQTGGAQVSGQDDQFIISSSDETKIIKVNALGGVSVQ